MPYYNREHATSAVTAGSFLPLCIISGRSSTNPLDDFYSIVDKNLGILGVDTSLDNLSGLHRLSMEEIVDFVANMKSRLIGALERAYAPAISSWFELGFSISLMATAATTSDRISVVSDIGGDLKKRVAARVGYPESKLDRIFNRLRSGDAIVEIVVDFLREAEKVIQKRRLFISYGSGDLELAEEFSRLCERAGIETFVANIDISPGTDWYSRIGEEIRQSDEVLLIISPQSIRSPWVMIEVGAAWGLGKPIIPAVLYEDIDTLPEPIKRFQAQKIVSTADRRNLIKGIAKRMHT